MSLSGSDSAYLRPNPWSDLLANRPSWGRLVVFLSAYILAAGVAKWLAIVPGTGVSIWPSSGLFVATLVMSRKAAWPWWIVAAVAAENVANFLWFHNPLLVAVLFNVGNSLESVAGALLILLFCRAPVRLESLREVLALVVLGAGLAPTITATIGATTLTLFEGQPFLSTWMLLWIGDATGVLIVAPLALVVIQNWREKTPIPLPNTVEALIIGVILVGVGALSLSGYLSFAYIVMPPLLWAAIRFEFKGAVVTLVLLAMMTAAFTIAGLGQFAGDPEAQRQRQIMLQLFLAISALSALVVAAISRQHQQSLLTLRQANEELESRVAGQTEYLRDREHFLQRITDITPGVLRVFDVAAQRSVFLNRSVTALLGYESTEPLPDGAEALTSLMHPADRAAFERHMEHLRNLGDGEVAHFEYRLRGNDGQWRWFHTRDGVFERDSEGTVVQIIQASVETTLGKRDEEALRLRHEHARQLADISSRLVLRSTDGERESVDELLKSVFTSVASHLDVEFYFNFSVGDEPGSLRLVSSQGIDADTSEMLRVIQFGEQLCGLVAQSLQPLVIEDLPNCDLQNADALCALGAQAYAGFPMISNGKLIGTISFASSRRIRFVQEEIEFVQVVVDLLTAAVDRDRLAQAVHNADRRKDEFLATLAHELRNPLAPVRMAIQLFQTQSLTPEMIWARDVIDRQTLHLNRLIDDLMDISRINQGKIELKPELVELSSIVQGAVETSRPLIEQMGHELAVDAPEAPILVRGDVTRLSQVLLNLLNNAAKYTEHGGRITLRAEAEGEEVVVSVKDSGIGIPVENLPTIFDMFSQVEGALSRSQGGLGIGLSLVKRLVEHHGGRISAHSEGPGTGSEFIVRLPILVESSMSLAQEPEVRPHSVEGLRVLVVDDNQDAAISLAKMIELTGNAVTTAFDGKEALRLAESTVPHVIVLDIGLPELNGYEVAAAIRKAPWGNDMLIIALTGWGQDEDRSRSKEAGIDHHLIKPVDFARLRSLIAERFANTPVR